MIQTLVDNGTIRLGYVSDNEATVIQFPIANAYALFGEGGDWYLLHRRPTETTAYAIPTEQITTDDDFLYWTVSSYDVEVYGNGEVQLQYRLDDLVKMSQKWRTAVSASLVDSGTVPDPYEAWLDQLAEYADRAETAAEAAEAASTHSPYIGDNGDWYVWDSTTSAYVDTGVSAEAQSLNTYTETENTSGTFGYNAAINADQITFNALDGLTASVLGATTIGGDTVSIGTNGNDDITIHNDYAGNVNINCYDGDINIASTGGSFTGTFGSGVSIETGDGDISITTPDDTDQMVTISSDYVRMISPLYKAQVDVDDTGAYLMAQPTASTYATVRTQGQDVSANATGAVSVSSRDVSVETNNGNLTLTNSTSATETYLLLEDDAFIIQHAEEIDLNASNGTSETAKIILDGSEGDIDIVAGDVSIEATDYLTLTNSAANPDATICIEDDGYITVDGNAIEATADHVNITADGIGDGNIELSTADGYRGNINLYADGDIDLYPKDGGDVYIGTDTGGDVYLANDAGNVHICRGGGTAYYDENEIATQTWVTTQVIGAIEGSY